MAGLSWRAVLRYVLFLALIEAVTYLLADRTGFGEDDPLATGILALTFLWIAAAAVALGTAIRSRPRWAEWTIATAVVIVAAAVLFEVFLGSGTFGDRFTGALTTLWIEAALFASAVAAGLCLGIAFRTGARTRAR